MNRIFIYKWKGEIGLLDWNVFINFYRNNFAKQEQH